MSFPNIDTQVPVNVRNLLDPEGIYHFPLPASVYHPETGKLFEHVMIASCGDLYEKEEVENPANVANFMDAICKRCNKLITSIQPLAPLQDLINIYRSASRDMTTFNPHIPMLFNETIGNRKRPTPEAAPLTRPIPVPARAPVINQGLVPVIVAPIPPQGHFFAHPLPAVAVQTPAVQPQVAHPETNDAAIAQANTLFSKDPIGAIMMVNARFEKSRSSTILPQWLITRIRVLELATKRSETFPPTPESLRIEFDKELNKTIQKAVENTSQTKAANESAINEATRIFKKNPLRALVLVCDRLEQSPLSSTLPRYLTAHIQLLNTFEPKQFIPPAQPAKAQIPAAASTIMVTEQPEKRQRTEDNKDPQEIDADVEAELKKIIDEL